MKLKDLMRNIKNSMTNKKHLKLKVEIANKTIDTIIAKDIDLQKFQKMYNWNMVTYKHKFLRPFIWCMIYLGEKINRFMQKPSFIKSENVNSGPENRIFNIARETLMQSLSDAALLLKKDLVAYNDPMSAPYLQLVKNVHDNVMQIAYYDTVYRGIFEIWCINLSKRMVEEFNKDPSHVLYNKKFLNDPDFMMAVKRNDGGHLVLNDEDGIIVIPRCSAIKINKTDVETLYNELNVKKNKKDYCL